MASHAAIAAVSRTLRTLLLDRMVTGAEITLAPPDVEVTGVSGPRVNLYLMQVMENIALKNQEIPGTGHPAAFGHPPLSLGLRYLMTTHSAVENQGDADINAQTGAGWTAYTFAVWKGEVELEQLLLGHGAKPNVVDKQGWRALEYAPPRASAAEALSDAQR